ncbi:MAG: hypothetical protein K6U10_11130 [Acidobacteriia bacterium]|nr:hypothetical protein [Methyloceanibacter sp.]MCL6492351.1 hypothetical protein [Terriglobia bacterium]
MSERTGSTPPTQLINPMAGPAYIGDLCDALEKRTTGNTIPPSTGEKQISIRLDDFVFDHIETIAEESGWSCDQVLHALINRGLFDLYQLVSPYIGEKIVNTIVSRKFFSQLPEQEAGG